MSSKRLSSSSIAPRSSSSARAHSPLSFAVPSVAVMAKPSPLFLLLAALLLLAAAPAGLAAGGEKYGGKKSKGDGYYKPIAANKSWKLYKFAVTMKQTVTSFRPAPPPNDSPDANQPGALASLTSEIFNEDGEQVGIGSWNRMVVSNDPVNPDEPDGDRIANRLLVSVFEFGDPEDQYPDTLSVTVTTKWLLSPTKPSEFTDYEGIIGGGRGKFMGASGQVTVSDVVIEDNLLKEAVFNFRVYVPADLPKAW